MLLAGISGVVVAVLSSAAPANADPYTTPAAEQASCDVVLSPPRPAKLPGGAPAVSATMKPTTCHGSISVTDVTVCVAKAEGPSLCNNVTLNESVDVYLPTSTTGTFTSSGRLCGLTLAPIQTICSTKGPYTETF